MKVLITAGGTFTPIDKVRGITNIFSGRTGIDIGYHISYNHNDNVVNLLLQKHSKWVNYMIRETPMGFSGGIFHEAPHDYRLFHTYDDLYTLMETEITKGKYDVIIHTAAVSDYKLRGVYIDDVVDPGNLLYVGNSETGKFSSGFSNLYLKLTKTEKIVDKIRKDWGFNGILVKFKLEVGIEDEELISIAKESRVKSGANIMVANCLEWAKERAYVITEESVTKVKRDMLPHYLYGEICKLV